MKTIYSLRFRLILSFLIVSLIPFIMFLIFSINEGKKAIISNIKEDLKQRNIQTVKLIEKDFIYTITQLAFWANYPIMDDILVNDIDKRIAKFISSSRGSIDLLGDLLVINKEGRIIASTNTDLIGKLFPVKLLKSSKITVINFNKNNYFLMFNPVFSSFSKVKIGYIIFLADVSTLNSFIKDEKGFLTFIYNEKVLPKKLFSVLNLKDRFMETQDFFFYYSLLSKEIFEDNWYVVSGISKSIAFAPVQKIQSSYLIIGILGVLGIFLLSIIMSNKIITPIEKLSEFARETAEKKNYSKRIDFSSKDEIGYLASSFNELLDEIQSAIDKLEKESKERLFLFIKLIQFFNKIVETKNKQEIISLLNAEIKSIFDYKGVYFSNTKKENALCFNLWGDVVEKKDEYLCFEIEKELSHEEKEFLKSISRLVALWLERLYLIQQLKELLEKAEASSKAKSAFIANMSHELRTPLNAIIGFSQYLETSPDLSEEYKQIAKNIELSGKHLLSLINDILDLAKIEAKKITPKKEKVNLKQLLEEIIAMILPLAQEKKIKLILPKDSNIEIFTDRNMLKQILINLLSNAVKFTEEGYVRFDIKEENGYVIFVVEDTGIGIAKENLDKIFEDFEQVQNPLQKKYKGTGLGLALVKRLTGMLNGEIEVISEGLGKGATFILKLPKGN